MEANKKNESKMDKVVPEIETMYGYEEEQQEQNNKYSWLDTLLRYLKEKKQSTLTQTK